MTAHEPTAHEPSGRDRADLALTADRQAIVEVACRYTWALDTKDWAGLDEVFLADATAVLGGPEVLEGREAIRARIRTALEHLDVSQHLVGSHVVDVAADGRSATHRCQLHAQHVRSAAGEDGHREGARGPLYVVAGVYDDRFVRTVAGWRIAHRTLRVTWTSGNLAVVRP